MTIIHLGQPSPTASSNLPGSPFGTDGGLEARTPLFGLAPGGVCPAASCYQSRGALLPHHFTLTGLVRRYIFCGTFRGLSPPRRYLAPCPKEPGLSSAVNRSDCLADSGSLTGDSTELERKTGSEPGFGGKTRVDPRKVGIFQVIFEKV